MISTGWVPAGLALGISVGSRHDDWLTVGQTRWGAGNAEVVGYTELVNDARHDARQQLEKDVAPARRGRRRGPADGHAGSRARVPDPGGPPRSHRGGDDRGHRHRPVRPVGQQHADHRWRSCRSTRSAARRPGSGWTLTGSFRLDWQYEQGEGNDDRPAERRAERYAEHRTDAAEGVPQDAMRPPRRAAPGTPGSHLHLGPVRQRVPAGPRGRVPAARPGAGQLDLPRRPAGRPLGQEPGTRRALPGHVPRPGAGDDPDGGRGGRAAARTASSASGWTWR